MKGNLVREGLLAFLAFFTFILLIGGTGLVQGDVGNFFAEESAKLKANRIVNAAMTLSSIPSGRMEIEMSGYKVKSGGGMVAVKKGGKEVEASFADTVSDYDSYNGPSDYEQVSDTLCVRKSKSGGDEALHIEPDC